MDDEISPMAFDIAMGVRKGDEVLRQQVDRALSREAGQIRQILKSYGVPLTVSGDSGTALE